MSDFKVGDRVRILPGVATPFIGMDGTICEIRPHDRGILDNDSAPCRVLAQGKAVLLQRGADAH